MRSYFVSDIHLSNKDKKLSDAFINFLNEIKGSCSQLFILGDLFEIWIGDDDDSEYINTIKSELLKFTNTGPDTFFMHGNRDFLIGEQFSKETGIKILSDPHQIEIDRKKVLLSHGDAFCIDDVDYINFRNQVRDKSWQTDFLSKSIDERRSVASNIKNESNIASEKKSMDITDVNERAIQELINKHSSDFLIHGHTHRPNIHENQSSKRIVLGDWDDFGWYFWMDEDSYNLEKFSIT